MEQIEQDEPQKGLLTMDEKYAAIIEAIRALPGVAEVEVYPENWREGLYDRKLMVTYTDESEYVYIEMF